MSHFVQLLGSDVPDSYGGCCYYGTMFSQLWETASDDEAVPRASSAGSSTKTNAFEAYEKEEEGYLCFNCPEGTQRCSSEAGIRLTRVKCFCFTRYGKNAGGIRSGALDGSSSGEQSTSPGNHGEQKLSKGACSAWMGLPGLLFTINDAGASLAHFMGPSSTPWAPIDVKELCGENVGIPALHHIENPPVESTETSSTRLMMRSLRTLNRSCVRKVNVFQQEETSEETKKIVLRGEPAGLQSSSSSRSHQSASGLEKFLHALQRHYFRYRRMLFFHMQPLIIDLATVISDRPHNTLFSHSFSRQTPGTEMNEGIQSPEEGARALHKHTHECPDNNNNKSIDPAPAVDSEDFVALLPLSTHSFLLRFRTSPKLGGEKHLEENSGDTVYSYIIVEAPPGTFDASLAKRRGVRPGPKYGLLKSGHEVEADMDAEPAEGCAPGYGASIATGSRCKRERSSSADKADEKSQRNCEGAADKKRMVYPHEVMRRTKCSTRLYLSFICDSDSLEDLQHALSKLFAVSGTESLFTQLLQRYLPSMLYVADGVMEEGGDDITVGRTPSKTTMTDLGPLPQRERRRLVIRQMVHLQPTSYFLRCEAMNIDAKAMFMQYIQDLMKPLQGLIEVPAEEGNAAPNAKESPYFMPSQHQPVFNFQDSDRLECETNSPSVGSSTLISRHLFTAYVYRFFTAFPTALVHRYHLHLLSPTLFPVRSRAVGECVPGDCPISDEECAAARIPVTYWPYSFKFRSIPEECRPAPSSSQSKKLVAVEKSAKMVNVLIDDVSRLIRYPTYSSSVELLSVELREKIMASHRHTEDEEVDPLNMAARKADERCWSLNSALVFMGTGSAVPSKYRNVSGTYVQVNLPRRCFPTETCTTAELGEDSLRRVVVVLDWGEGSCGQLHRLLNEGNLNPLTDVEEKSEGLHSDNRWNVLEGTQTIRRDGDYLNGQKSFYQKEIDFLFHSALSSFLRDLEIIFLSHAHADHHLGVISLIELRHQFLCCHPEFASTIDPLTVVCPTEVYEWMCDSWFSTEPYASYVFKECEFDVLPSFPDSHSRLRSFIAPCSPDGEQAFGKDKDFCVVKPIPRLEKRLERWNTALRLYHSTLSGSRVPSWAAETFTVVHPANAHALLLRFPVSEVPLEGEQKEGMNDCHPSLVSKVLLFSGDTRPCQSLVQRTNSFLRRGSTDDLAPSAAAPHLTFPHGKPAHPPSWSPAEVGWGEVNEIKQSQRLFICLHEATFGPGFEVEAVKKCHSTLGEALSIGVDALNAQFVVLNHFSQRYPKIPDISAAASSLSTPSAKACPEGTAEILQQTITADQLSQRLSFAFDGMFLSFKALYSEDMKNFLPLSLLLLDEYASWEQGTTARMREDHSKNRKKK